MQQGKSKRVACDEHGRSEQRLRALLADVLAITAKSVAAFEPDTELFGALPEFDSMAVATLLTGIEETFDVLIEDDDVEAEDFLTFGALSAFVERLTARD
ncbi:MAG: acyl carrier protein [Sphingomicrobium sp.]